MSGASWSSRNDREHDMRGMLRVDRAGYLDILRQGSRRVNEHVLAGRGRAGIHRPIFEVAALEGRARRLRGVVTVAIQRLIPWQRGTQRAVSPERVCPAAAVQ